MLSQLTAMMDTLPVAYTWIRYHCTINGDIEIDRNEKANLIQLSQVLAESMFSNEHEVLYVYDNTTGDVLGTLESYAGGNHATD